MAGILKALLSMIALFGMAKAISKTCNLYSGKGCTSGGAISFSYTGLHSTPNSRCRRTYRLILNVPTGQKGYSCKFSMDKPHHNKYVYSIAETPTAIGANSQTAYIYGRGLDSYAKTRTTGSSIYKSNYYNYNDIHTHPDNNRYSTITYVVENNKLRMYGTAGHRLSSGNVYWFKPALSSKKAYIGINRRYANTISRGSGVCEVYCRTF